MSTQLRSAGSEGNPHRKTGWRFARYAGLATATALVMLGGSLLYSKFTLHRYRHFIENRYRAELTLIESEMRTGKELDLTTLDLDAIEARDKVRDIIGQTLSGPEFFEASWSYDGHHGRDSLKLGSSGGYGWYRQVGSSDSHKLHTLHFGKTDNGTKLLIYVGWVQSGWKRHYKIAFDRSEIDLRMKRNGSAGPGRAPNKRQSSGTSTNPISPKAGSPCGDLQSVGAVTTYFHVCN